MVFPLYDDNPFKWPTPPYVTWSLIAINVAVFALQSAVGPADSDLIERAGALIPAAFTAGAPSASVLPAPLTLVTSMFLHANFMHIFGNMIFLWVFGDDIEEAIGPWRFLGFYFACGIVGGLAFVLTDPQSTTALIGASGAVAGVIAAYLLYRPCAKVTMLYGIIPLRLRAFWLIGGWAIYQFVEVASRVQDGVAYMVHVGGLIAGSILFVVMRPPGIQLLECTPAAALPAASKVKPPH